MCIKQSTLAFKWLLCCTLAFVLSACGGGSEDEDATLSALTINGGELDQIFQSASLSYTSSVEFLTSSITLQPVSADTSHSIMVNGVAVSSGSESESLSLVEGLNTITVQVTSGNSTTDYVLEVTRAAAGDFAQQYYIKASDAAADASFGVSVAIDGDTMAVGAYGVDTQTGGVYLFTRDSDVWTEEDYVQASNLDAYDNFGISVSLDGDTLVVGSHKESSVSGSDEDDNTAGSAGAAYVFTRSGTTWTQQAYLKASDATSAHRFGNSVAVNGDTVVVGASQGGTNSAGAAYVFTRTATSWSQQQLLTASNQGDDDLFGSSVDIEGDIIVVGASGESSGDATDESDNTEEESGAVYVFTRTGTIWTQQDYLKASNVEEEDYFGVSVSLSGDSIAVGAYGEDSSASGGQSNNDIATGGAVYIFVQDGTTWTQQGFIKSNDVEVEDYFGESVALDGDTLVVGASGVGLDDSANNNMGGAYVFIRSGTSWSQQQAFIQPSNAEASDRFGASVALSGDTVVLGADGEDSNTSGDESDNSALESGAAYVWQ